MLFLAGNVDYFFIQKYNASRPSSLLVMDNMFVIFYY